MFAPVIPLAGVGGLRFIDRTYDRQVALFEKSPEIRRDIDHFREVAGSFETAAELVADTRALRVVLGAFGLEDELPKRAFIRKILEEGTIDPRALSNRLAAPAWRKMSEALGFGDGGNRMALDLRRDEVVERFRTRQFERAVGETDVDIRLALNFRREIAEIAAKENVARVGWFEVMGSPPLRQVVERAFGLPDAFARLDIDQQKAELESISRRRLGGSSPEVFQDPVAVEGLLRDFLVRSQLANGPGQDVRGAAALSILQAGSLASGARAGLFSSLLR
jgi:hypothetical protein